VLILQLAELRKSPENPRESSLQPGVRFWNAAWLGSRYAPANAYAGAFKLR